MGNFLSSPVKVLNFASSSIARDTSASADIAAQLKKRIQLLYVNFISASGVDYDAMRNSADFAAFVSETRRLPSLDVPDALPDDAHKIAFFVNLYNACTLHAVTTVGAPPNSSVLRLLFAMMVGYAVGPYQLSLNDMENGILRANRGVSILPSPFSKRDPRLALAVHTLDARIHFVLNCAANSCPPVLFLTADNLEHSLQIATRGFLADGDNFSVDGKQIELSQIFNWYKRDFAPDGSDRALLQFVLDNADPTQQSTIALARLLEPKDGQFCVSWKPYDWSLNSS